MERERCEREILRNTTLELGYVGSKGGGCLSPYDANQVPCHRKLDRLDFIHAGTDSDARAALRPYGVFGNENIAILDHGGSSIYHSLQTQLVSRFGRGSQFQASYTFSRTIGDVSLTGGENGIGSASVSLLENPGLDRGLTQTHRKHIFNASLVLVLPELRGQVGLREERAGRLGDRDHRPGVLGGPLTVYTGPIPGLTNRVSGTGQTTNQRPNVVPGQSCHASGGLPEQILNPDAWTLTGFELGTFGNSGRGVCEGPNFVQVDLALYKNIKISQKREGPAAVRGLQRLQPRQLRGRQHQPEPDQRHPRHRQSEDGDADHRTSSPRATSARPAGPAIRGRRSSASS